MEPEKAAIGTWISLTREEEACRVLYCFADADVVRACGTKYICHRRIPSPHKRMVETPTSHAPEVRFLSLVPNQKDSKVLDGLDGLARSHHSEEDHQADLQRRTEIQRWHVVWWRRLPKTAVVSDMRTPVHTNRTSRFAQPPHCTHGSASTLHSRQSARLYNGD